MRSAAGLRFPGHNVWEPLGYPGRETLPVHIMPLIHPLSPQLQTPLDELHERMRNDNVLHGFIEPYVRYEHRQGHIWVAGIDHEKFLPIGQTIFLAELKRPVEAEPSAPAEKPSDGPVLRLVAKAPEETRHEEGLFDEKRVARWWLFYTWIQPAYRFHKIFKFSVDYFHRWHPDFVLRESAPALMEGLKQHPEHLPSQRAITWS